MALVLSLGATSGCVPPEAAVEAKAEVKKQLGVTGAGSALERLTSDPVTETHPSISPDGHLLLFEVRVYENDTSDEIKQQTLVGIDPNTRAQRTLFTSTNSLSDHPAWLPDQSSYVYASNSPGDWSLVRALTAAPNAAVNVIASGEIAPAVSWPTISPDGKRVAFSTNIRNTQTIAVINLDGSHLTLLGEGSTPAWSPDGRQLVFSRTVNDHEHLFLISADTGTDLIQLTTGEFDHTAPSWSPDGHYIVFSTNRGWNTYPGGSAKRIRNLYLLAKDGTGLTQLTSGDASSESPCWGKDQWIYFASNQSDNFDIWRLRPSGGYANLESPRAPAPSPDQEHQDHATPMSVVPAPAQAAGCVKDTDCRGDRICEKGACVNQPPKAKP